MHFKRINKLISCISENEGILITNEKNCFYFSGINSSNICLYITKNKRFLITDFRYLEVSSKNMADFEVLWKKRRIEQLKDVISEEKVYVETDSLSVDEYELYKQNLNCEFLKADTLIKNIRLYKDEFEINCIKKAQEIADKAFLNILDKIKTGVSESDVKAELEYEMLRAGSQKPSFDTIVLFGNKTSLPHGEPDGNVLKANDIILIDFGATYMGYRSDTTRTFFKGEPDKKMIDAYNHVNKAHDLAFSFIKRGVMGSEADKTARDYLDKNGYENLFGHSLGHGTGLDIHESPSLSLKSKDILENNMTFSVEPGVYFENEFGIRIENLCYLSDCKPYSFTKLSRNLLII